MGSKSHHCSRCGDKAEITAIPASGHSYGGWYETQAPTCIEEGTNERKCIVCQNAETKTINALGHIEANAVEENKHAATCISDGSYDSVIYCFTCGDELERETKVLDKIDHSYTDWVISTVSTCITGGQERKDCINCDHFETRDTSALGHDIIEHEAQAATCTEIGWNAYESCSRCDYTTYAEIASNGHTFGEWSQTHAPQNETKGEERRDCDDCEFYETREIDALGYLSEFIDAVTGFSTDQSAEIVYSELYEAVQLYAKLTDEEKEEAYEYILVLQSAIDAYNESVNVVNDEMEVAIEIAFIPISANFAFLAALWFLLKKKFWFK